MKVLIACEESQRVCIEFRKLGHEAWSCDLGPCSGGHEEWHMTNRYAVVSAPFCGLHLKPQDGKSIKKSGIFIGK